MQDAPKIQLDRRPRAYPAPEFPPRKPRLFARTPPAIFPVILGLLGLGLAARKAAGSLGLAETPAGGVVEAALGALLVLWAFAVLALLVKVARRPAVLVEDMKVLPGRAGLAAASMSAMVAAAVLVPYAPGAALWLALGALVAHAGLAVLLLAVILRLPPEARGVTPAFHLAFVGFIVAALPLVSLGWLGLATGIFWATLAAAVLIWGASARQFLRMVPPAPLRPLLAIHLAPAALLSQGAGLLGMPELAMGLAVVGAVLFLALLSAARWLTASGFSAMWGSFTFPLASFTSALLALGGTWEAPGMALLALSLAVIPAIGWNVLKLWPGNRLATRTNAAEA